MISKEIEKIKIKRRFIPSVEDRKAVTMHMSSSEYEEFSNLAEDFGMSRSYLAVELVRYALEKMKEEE